MLNKKNSFLTNHLPKCSKWESNAMMSLRNGRMAFSKQFKNSNILFPRALVRKCMEVLFYRDARAFQRYQLGIVTSAGVRIEDVAELKHDWSLAHMIHMK